MHSKSTTSNTVINQEWSIPDKVLTIFCCSLLTLFIANLFIVNKVLAETLSDSNAQPPITVTFNAALQAELLSMQQASNKLHQRKFSYPNGRLPEELIEQLTDVSSQNSERLLSIIKTHGWPSIHLVGMKGRDAALVILQQATASVQKSVLPMLESEFKRGQLSGQKLASVIDIMLIKSGEKQRYGTQLAIVNGQIVFNEIADEKNLEQRRLAMNMLPMTQYKVLLKKMYQLD